MEGRYNKVLLYSVNNLNLKKFYSNMEFMGILQFADRTLCPKIAFCVQCYSVLYFLTAYFSVYEVNSYTILNRNYYLYQKSSRYVHLFGITITNRIDYAIKICIYVRGVICFYS